MNFGAADVTSVAQRQKRCPPGRKGRRRVPSAGARREVTTMLTWAIIFFIVAIIAGVLGFAGIAGTAAWIAKVLFIVFLILFVVMLLFGRRSV